MKKLFSCILLLVLPMLLYSTEIKQIYNVVVLKEWKPYYFLDKNGKPTGFGIELFEAVAKESNLRYKYQVVDTAKEVIQALKSSNASIIPNIGYSKKRNSYLEYSAFTDTSRLLLFKRVKSESLNNLDNVKEIAVVEGNVANAILKKNYPNIKLKVYETHFNALRALLSGEVDVFSYPEPIMNYTLKELNIDDKIVSFYKSLSETKRTIAVIKKDAYLLNSINDSLETIKKNGKYDELHQKWFGKEKVFTRSELISFSIYLVSFIVFLLGGTIFLSLRKNWLMTKTELKKEIANQKNEIEKQTKIILSQSKVTAVGEMLGNIAHQWRQPLNVISIATSILKLSIDLDNKLTKKEINEYITKISLQVEYLSKTIDDFRNFFCTKNDEVKLVNLKETINKVEGLVTDSFKNNNIKIVLDLYDFQVLLNESLFIQSIINLCNNSKDAMLINNTDEKFLFISFAKYDDGISISVKDSGNGIDNDLIDNIFEPYFTTKFESKGTGLGLYIVHQIVTNHLKGQVYVENTEYEYKDKIYKGAEFIIKIPENKVLSV